VNNGFFSREMANNGRIMPQWTHYATLNSPIIIVGSMRQRY